MRSLTMLMTQADKASIGRSRGKASPDPDALNFRACDMFDIQCKIPTCRALMSAR